MPTYILIGNYTHEGMEKIRGAPTRIDTAREIMNSLGARLECWYLTMGQYDFVAIVDAPNDEVLAKLLLAMGSHGNIRTQTLRAFNEDQFRELVTNLPY